VAGKYKGKINIERFTPFKLSKGKLAKKVIRLSTRQKLSNSTTSSTPMTVTLKAYAKEKPNEIVVFRKAVFIYPRADELNIK
jgi:hypothetical protein